MLDLRPAACRRLGRVADGLRFDEDTRAVLIEEPAFGLAVTYTGDPAFWAPHRGTGGTFVAAAGRPAFDDGEWAAAQTMKDEGGLAGRIIHAGYRTEGIGALERLNGNCAVIVHDAPRGLIHLVTDCAGVFPVFEVEVAEGRLYGSHPDILADAANERHRVDEVSLAEFILSGTVSPPFSYYQRVRATDHGTILTLHVGAGRPLVSGRRRYFDLAYRGDPGVPEHELAGSLAAALRRAVTRRTLPRFGPAAVALSGGLDSRVVLASSLDNPETFAFSCFDRPNRESRAAAEIARVLSVPLLSLQRGPDYYADHAERGVRIAGGMGNLANNHFLGVMPRLKAEGMASLVTGCYCDYLFKGLPLNRRVHPLTHRERLGPFRHAFYFEHVAAPTTLGEAARARYEARVPPALRAQRDAAAVFDIEARRTFPLCYEGDNQQRLVPQRLTGWSPPFGDREVLEVYRRIPYAFKLNRSIFRKVVALTVPGLAHVPDANTGAVPGASAVQEWVRMSQRRLQRAWRRVRSSPEVEDSWPDWRQYLAHSRAIDSLWRRPNPDAQDLFRRVLGPAVLRDEARLKREQPFLFVGLLTVKLWLDQRA